MKGRDQEGWKDDTGDNRRWHGVGRVRAGGSGVFRETHGTEPGDVQQGGRRFVETSPTMPSESLTELYGLLVVFSGPRRFDVYRIDKRKVTIGRDHADVQLDDSAVSRQHAVIAVTGNDTIDAEFCLYDRGPDGLPSTTGTIVNGKFVSQARLADRDRIKVGDTELVFLKLWPEVS